MKLFKTELTLRSHYCKLDDNNESCVEEPYLNLYIQFNGCNANCPFCCYKQTCNSFNFEKLERIVNHILNKVKIRRVLLTGGEPTLHLNDLERTIKLIKKLSPKSFFCVNTNGTQLIKLFNTNIVEIVDNISLSRHHYNDDKNDTIFGIKTASTPELREIISSKCGDKIHFACNLIKGYIDDQISIRQYLEYVNDLGGTDIGFVTLYQINNYCRDHFVPFPEYTFTNLFPIKQWNYKNKCSCKNFLYLPQNFHYNALRIYNRCVLNPMDMTDNLVYDGEYLTVGFNGETIQ